jgi:hypothetical protein
MVDSDDWPWIAAMFGTIFSGVAGWIAARIHTNSEEKLAQEARTAAITASIEASVAARFKVLIDGYETRVAELTEDIARMRAIVERCELCWKIAHGCA